MFLMLIYFIKLINLSFLNHILKIIYPSQHQIFNLIIVQVQVQSNIIMAKQKQQRQKRKKIKQGTHDKQKMKQVLRKLGENKAKNITMSAKLASITQINNQKHKKISKSDKKLKNKLNNDKEQQQQIQTNKIEDKPKPMINLFSVDSFQAEKPVIVHNPLLDNNEKNKMSDETDLQSRARKVMGQNFNMNKFGEKPLRIKQDNNEPVVMSDDEDQPNSIKMITHFNIKIPQGNRSFNRRKQIQQIRQKLPIYMKEQQIVQTINNHLVTLICGQTGSGKSTQLPQFLAEKNYQKLGKIAITQPRRLATVSLARRVAQQMNCKIGNEVAYQVRHERKQSQNSFIKFMTDGILLKEMSSDSLLLEYSVIIIDEAHERKLNTDILIGLLSRLILVRYKMSQQNINISPLRLIIMSATLRVTDFQNQKLFNFHVPIVKVQAKMFPVTIFHQRTTPQSYIESAVTKCVKIHKQLPNGDVLIFLTGKQQIHEMFIRLEMELNRLKMYEREAMMQNQSEGNQGQNDQIKVQGEFINTQAPVRKLSTASSHNNAHMHSHPTQFIIYKLYSSLPSDQQDKIFQPAPPGTRKFIISTNISQTSVTVPNIRYVIDSGQQKYRYFDGIWKWSKGWGSRAMAKQRAGRAGRTMHGYCYRLYSTALYANIMEQHPEPQICRLPLQSVVLQVKAIGFTNIFSFPFPTIPPVSSLKKSLENLLQISAIQGTITVSTLVIPPSSSTKQQTIQKQQKQSQPNPSTNFNSNSSPTITTVIDNCKITELGKIISFIPLAPKLAKMLLIGNKINIGKYVLIIAVLLTVQDIFKGKFQKNNNYEDDKNNNKMSSFGKNRQIQQRKLEISQFNKKYGKYMIKQCGSDIFLSMNIVGQFLRQLHSTHKSQSQPNSHSHTHVHASTIQHIISSLSQKLSLNPNTMRQFYYNCDQITQIYQTLTSTKIDLSTYNSPTASQCKTILQLLLSSYHTNICRLQNNNIYTDRNNNQIYVHRMSVLYKEKCMFVGCVDFYLNQINGRKYMRYPFKVENYQLLASFGRVREVKEYMWDRDNGEVVGKVDGEIYGWEIPNLVVRSGENGGEVMKGQGKYYAFARLLLDGEVIPSLRILKQKKWLNSTTNSIRPDNLAQKVQRLVMEIRKNNLTSKDKLVQLMKNNVHFLEKQLKYWLDVKNYQAVYQIIRKSIISSN